MLFYSIWHLNSLLFKADKNVCETFQKAVIFNKWQADLERNGQELLSKLNSMMFLGWVLDRKNFPGMSIWGLKMGFHWGSKIIINYE